VGGDEGLGAVWDSKGCDAIRAEVGDEYKGYGTPTGRSFSFSSLVREEVESVRCLSSGLFVLNSTIASFRPNAVVVGHSLQQLCSCKVVALDGAGSASEVLDTVSGGLPSSSAGDLPEENVPRLGSGGAAIGDGQGDGVGGGCSKFSVHVVSSISPTNCRRIDACLTCGRKLVTAYAICLIKARNGLEINPELANVVRAFVHFDFAASGGGRGVGAGVVGVPDVTGVGRDSGTTCVGSYQAANSKSCGTVAISRAALLSTLRGGVARAVCGGRTRSCAASIWKLDNGEERKCSSGAISITR